MHAYSMCSDPSRVTNPRPKRVLFAALVVFAGCSPTYELDDFRIGLTRAEVEARFGAPDRADTLVKTTEVIFGPIETLWGQVPMGATVELWSYPAKNGSIELYFVEGSPLLKGVSSLDEGAVY